MLKLPNVTLFAIDCISPERTVAALKFSTQWVRFAEVILLTDTQKFNPPGNPWLKIVHHEEGTEKVERPYSPWHKSFPVDYELAVMREPSQHVKTSHLIHMEWDSAVLNRSAWTEDWLQYDFIGAPWVAHHEPGWPPCDGHTNNVGNGGFSLKSVRFCELTRAATEVFKGDLAMYSSDAWPCRSIRPWLEERSMKFAPERVADRFSCENRIYSGQFGMHGRETCEINNWGGPFFGGIRPTKPLE
jgi:hypothetical protein